MGCIFEMEIPMCKGCTTRRDCWCCDKIGDWIRDRMDVEQHGDLISRSALLDALRDTEFCMYVPLDEIDAVIDNAPAVEAEPVRHGRWEYGMQCSFCKQIDTTKPNYCPNCGADMRGANND